MEALVQLEIGDAVLLIGGEREVHPVVAEVNVLDNNTLECEKQGLSVSNRGRQPLGVTGLAYQQSTQ